MATQQMNSREWWDDYFDHHWSENGGQNQTWGFMTTLISNLPDAELAYLRDGGPTILDWGCAMGDGVGLLGATFPRATVAGLDFAERALETARRAYPQHTFIHTADGSIPSSFDVIVTSNCLEHFQYPLEVASRHLRSCRDLYIVLVPFNEQQPLLDQHMTQFREDTFPERLGGFTRLVSQPVDVSSLYWPGQQLLVVYGSDQYLARRKTEPTSAELADVGNVRVRVLREDYLRISQGAVRAAQHDTELWRIAQEKDRVIDGLRVQFHADLKSVTQQRDAAISERDHHQIELESAHRELESFRLRERQIRERADAQEERLDRYQRDLNLVYSTKAWRWTSAYWQLRQQGLKGYLLLFIRLLGILLLSPFWLVYQIVRLVYHVLIPKPLRLWLWNWRWRITHRAEVAALKSGGRNGRRSHGVESASHQYAKTGKHFFIFAGVPFYDIGGGQRSAQLAKTLNKMGYSVHYIYAAEASDTGERVADIPVIRHVALSDYSPKQLISELMGEPVFIFEIPAPQFEPYLELASTIRAKVVYEHIDNWETSLGSTLYSELTYRSFLLNADTVVATARPLQEKVLQFMAGDHALAGLTEKVIYLANAVDTDLFDPAFQREMPADLVIGNRTLLYYGSLWGEWFDWSLIMRVANECPQCSINLIGDYKPVENLTKQLPKNVHFLGAKLQSELPAYLAYTDITLLPFKNDDIGKYVSPLKVFEYIAMNKRVLATALPDILGYPNVYASNSGDEWVSYVRDMHSNSQPEGATSFAFASANNWYARCNGLLDSLEAQESQTEVALDQERPRVSVITLNHNNRKVIGRCLDSIFQYSKRYDIEVIVVDNQSSDGSDAEIEQRYGDRITFLRNSKNGCSSGRNLGVSHAHGDYLLFVDSDQWAVSERWLDTSLHILQAYRNIGAVSWSGGWFSKGSFGGPITAYMPNGGVHPAQYIRTDIAYLGSGGLLMRRDVWNATDGFDEFYDPTVFEDTDLALQIKDMGFELAYTPYMNLMHLPHQTTKSGSEAHQRLMDRNSAYFGKKWKARNPKLLECYLH